ncbi:hypothetical protein OUZ56_014449 [Daphnia magna]|uniref:Uncharacterized protein n=1 Tax=Daphnia magna TaxID=35525 RepID=A0ABR0AJS1_9CRUS|nr:hypothetical protein OUZ56_014449 [Daphnia magna]
MKRIKTARRCIQGYDDTQGHSQGRKDYLELLEKIHPMWTWFFTLKINSYIFSIKQYKYSYQHISPVLVSHVLWSTQTHDVGNTASYGKIKMGPNLL